MLNKIINTYLYINGRGEQIILRLKNKNSKNLEIMIHNGCKFEIVRYYADNGSNSSTYSNGGLFIKKTK